MTYRHDIQRTPRPMGNVELYLWLVGLALIVLVFVAAMAFVVTGGMHGQHIHSLQQISGSHWNITKK